MNVSFIEILLTWLFIYECEFVKVYLIQSLICFTLNKVELFALFSFRSLQHHFKALSGSFFAYIFSEILHLLFPLILSHSIQSFNSMRAFRTNGVLFVLLMGSFKRRSPNNCGKVYLDECSNVPAIVFFYSASVFLLITNRFKYITRALVLCLNVDM